jgi:hypothetical protein
VNSHVTKRFRAALQELPGQVRAQARVAYRLFQSDPHHPGLHFKPVRRSVYSVRIGRDYRALGVRNGDELTWFWIGSHADYDRLLDQL